MRKIYAPLIICTFTLIFNLAFAGSDIHIARLAAAQTFPQVNMAHNDNLRSITCDTLLNENASDSPTVFLLDTPGNGYISGNGALYIGSIVYPNLAVAEKYDAPSIGMHVSAAFVYFGITVINPSDSGTLVTAYVYDTTGTATATGGYGPGNALDSATITLRQIAYDITNLSYPVFNFIHQPALTTPGFFVSVSLPQISGDTIVIVTNQGTTGDGNGYLAFNISGQETWSSYDSLFEEPIGTYIFPLLCPSGNCFTSSDSISQTVCPGSSYLFGGTMLTMPGTYTDTLTAVGGCDSVVTLFLSADSISAAFTLQPSNTPHVWYIINQCSGNSLSYSWNWGDGSPNSTGDTPSHMYDTAGYYNVCVTITDSMGCSANYCDTNVYLFKNQSGQIITVQVLPQYPSGINAINTESLNINYYGNAVHFSEALAAPTQLRLYDMSGRVVMQQDDFAGSAWAIRSDIAQGIYIVQLQNANYSLTKKLMILQ